MLQLQNLTSVFSLSPPQYFIPPPAARLAIDPQHRRRLGGLLLILHTSVLSLQGIHGEEHVPRGADQRPPHPLPHAAGVARLISRHQPPASRQDPGHHQPAQQTHLQADPQVRGEAWEKPFLFQTGYHYLEQTFTSVCRSLTYF